MPNKTKMIADFNEAMLQFIMTHPPKGFSIALFQICIMSGRIEEATKALNEFKAGTIKDGKCSECGREYTNDKTDEDYLPDGSVCPSDDCPSHDDDFNQLKSTRAIIKREPK